MPIFFFQDRYLISQVNARLRFIRSRDSFALIDAEENRIIIEDVVLFVRKVKLSPAMVVAHGKKFEEREPPTAKYPVRRVVCKATTVAAELMDVTRETLFRSTAEQDHCRNGSK